MKDETLHKYLVEIEAQPGFNQCAFCLRVPNRAALSPMEKKYKREILNALKEHDLSLHAFRELQDFCGDIDDISMMYRLYPLDFVDYFKSGIGGSFHSLNSYNFDTYVKYIDSDPFPSFEKIKEFFDEHDPHGRFFSMLRGFRSIKLYTNFNEFDAIYLLTLRKIFKDHFREMLEYTLHYDTRVANGYTKAYVYGQVIGYFPFINFEVLQEIIVEEEFTPEEQMKIWEEIFCSYFDSSSSFFSENILNRYVRNSYKDAKKWEHINAVHKLETEDFIKVVRAIKDLIADNPVAATIKETGMEINSILRIFDVIKKDISEMGYSDWRIEKDQLVEILLTDVIFDFIEKNKKSLVVLNRNSFKNIICLLYMIVRREDQMKLTNILIGILGYEDGKLIIGEVIDKEFERMGMDPSNEFAAYYNSKILHQKSNHINTILLSSEIINNEEALLALAVCYQNPGSDYVPIFYNSYEQRRRYDTTINYCLIINTLNPENLSDDFLKKYGNPGVWYLISACKNLSNEFMVKYLDHIDLSYLHSHYREEVITQEVLELILKKYCSENNGRGHYAIQDLCKSAVERCSIPFIRNHLSLFYQSRAMIDKKSGKDIVKVFIKGRPELTLKDLI